MTKEIYISSTPHETRLAVVEDDQLAEIYYERENEYTLAGSVYKGKVTRVLPGMQSAFVDIGLERDAFLYVTDFAEEQEDSEEYVSLPAGSARGSGRSASTGSSGANGGSPTSSISPQPASGQRSSNANSTGEAADASVEAGEQNGSGGRRWRGRRGRRRGRGRAQQEQSTVAPVDSSGEAESLIEESTRFSGGPESSDSEAFPPDQEFTDRGDRESHPEASTSVEEQQHRTEARTQRTEGRGQHSQNERVVLPGESLSKYRGGTSAPLSTREPRPSSSRTDSEREGSKTVSSNAAFHPSTMVVAPLSWDGSDVLPGESLSSHKRHPDHSVQPENSRSDRLDSSPAQSFAEAEVSTDPTSQEATSEEAPAIESEFKSNLMPSDDSTSAEAPAHPDFHADLPQAEAETTSASYRFDPSTPSRYRQSGVAEREEEAGPSVSPEADDQPEDRAEDEVEAEVEVKSAPRTGVEDSESESDFQTEQNSEPEFLDRDSDPHVFDPGRGDLEEETMDEGEEEPFTESTLAADENYDELVEETLDSDSGLIGEVVRDQHIDRRTGFRRDPAAETEADASMGGPNADSKDEFAGVEAMDATELDEAQDENLDEEPEEEVEASDGLNGDRTPSSAPRPNRRGVRGRRQGPGGDRHRMRRSSAQTSHLPAITELLKPNQEILVQIAKEPIARKGARITSHIALPGRFLVFMPTVNNVGVSRKISSDEERQRLKRILVSEKGDAAGGFIVRTAAASASEEDLRADIRFLLSLWSEIRQRADNSKPPALIYHDLSLVERVLRDRVTEQFSAVWVDSEQDYERVLRFLNRFEPALVRRVKLYTKETPLFEQFGLQEEINKALHSKVWLKSGGSIVINQTEALVAIDINTGKYVGKTARLEDTILKTNLDAIPEIVRQIRLRDLGGIIVIDFIDMDERRNRNKVMQALEEELKSDRAPSKVLQFNDFGLVAITRKRVKQSLERTLSVPCFTCTGTGMVKGPVTVCNEIYIELRKMHRQIERGDILLRVNPEVVKQLKASNGRWLSDMEEISGKTIIVKSDAALPPDQFDIH